FVDSSTRSHYIVSLHDALPISDQVGAFCYLQLTDQPFQRLSTRVALVPPKPKLLLITVSILAFSRVSRTIGMSATSGSSSSMFADRKSTRLNSSHVKISYAVFC